VTLRRHVLILAPLVALGTGCGATRYEGAVDTTGVAVTTTTAPITGTTEELVEELATLSESLSGVMIADGDEDAVAARITTVWAAARDDVAASRPDLVDGFESNVAMCDRAVRFNRAADADKAGRNLRALADAYGR
jgi:hypothetical protein